MFPEQVHEFLPRDSRRTVKFTDDLEARVRADYAKYPVETGYGAGLFGAVDIGLPKDDIQPYQASVVVRRAQYEELSYFSAYTPVCGDRGHPNFDTLLAAVLRWSAICRPMHGSAGFALIFASGMSQNTKYALHLMKRFPGFHYVHGVDFALEAGNAHNRIKCINWLTILGDELVAELGGVDPMRAALEPVCKVHEYPGGIVIQAGEVPQLGDTYRNNVPEAYRIVARYTKALRFENYSPDGLFRVPGNLDDAEEALSWIRRFD